MLSHLWLALRNTFIRNYIGKKTLTTRLFTLRSCFSLNRAAVRDNKSGVLRTVLQTRVDFPFEVDLWSLGVTLYQCATGLNCSLYIRRVRAISHLI